MIALAAEAYAASKVLIEWGDNTLELDFPRPVLTMAEVSDAVAKRFPGIRPLMTTLSKGVCRVVFDEQDFEGQNYTPERRKCHELHRS